MRSSPLASLTLLAALLVLGCSPAERLAGQWVSTDEPPPGAEEPGRQEDLGEALGDALRGAARATSRIELELEPGGTGTRRNTALGVTREYPIWWRAESAGDQVVLHLSEDPGFEPEERWEVHFLARDRFLTRVPILGEVVFRRVTPRD